MSRKDSTTPRNFKPLRSHIGLVDANAAEPRNLREPYTSPIHWHGMGGVFQWGVMGGKVSESYINHETSLRGGGGAGVDVANHRLHTQPGTIWSYPT